MQLLKLIHRELSPLLYFEIGVRNGDSLKLARSACIGIDPEPNLTYSAPERVKIYRKTSDDFFATDAAHAIKTAIDLAFIDGMHLFEYALRDFMNVERYAASTSLVLVDDIFPNHPVQARRVRESKVWTGDVWKLLACLKNCRPDLVLIPVNSHPTGTLLVAGLDPLSRELTRKFDSVLREFADPADESPPEEILERRGAIDPDDLRVVELLRFLKRCRETSLGEDVVRERLAKMARHLVAPK